MKFTSTQENLARGLAIVSRVANRNVTLPILSNVLIKTEKGSVILSATNLELAISVRVRGKIHTEGSATAQAKLLTDYVALQESDHIDVEQDGTTLFISTPHAKSKILGSPASDFPVIPGVEHKNAVTMESTTLRNALSQTVFAAAQDETRPEISGLCFSFGEKALTLAATDSYRLAERTVAMSSGSSQIAKAIVPTRTAQEVLRLLPDGGDVTLYVTENQIVFSMGDTELTSRLIDGQYPDYQPIIPKSHETTVTVAVADLVQHVKAASLFCSPGMSDLSVAIDPAAKNLTIKAASSQLGEQESELPATIDGQANTIVLNYRYLLDGLTALGSARVRLGVTAPTSPALLQPEGSEDYRYLIMPIRQ
jgi:DNA polymerase-3 subunit beta